MTQFCRQALITGALLVSLDCVGWWVGNQGVLDHVGQSVVRWESGWVGGWVGEWGIGEGWGPPPGAGHRVDNRGAQSFFEDHS